MTQTVLSPQQAKQIIDRSQRDPVWFCSNALGVTLWQQQQAIIRSVAANKRTTVRSCSGSGKSYTASCVAIWFLYNFYPATVLTTAPTFRQVESILWREIAGRYVNAKYPLSGKLTSTKLELADNWFAIGLSTDEPERFQGFHNVNVLVIGDEGSGIPEAVYTAIENPMAAGNSKEMLIGNPTISSGTYYDSFQSPNYNPITISCFDTPNFTQFGITQADIESGTWKSKIGDSKLPYPALITPQWVAEMFTQWGKGSYMYQVYCLGNFPDAGVNNLIGLSWVERCIDRKTQPDNSPLVMSLDVSRYGDDESVLMLGRGNKILEIQSWGHQDTVYTAGRTARAIRQYNPSVVRVDSVGVGGGVADMLKNEFKNIIEEINVGTPAIDTEQFLNLRAELYWLTAKSLEKGELDIPDNAKLKSQLVDIRYSYNSKGQLVIESKEDMKKRGSKSPDYADALVMLMGKHSVPFKYKQSYGV